VGIENLDKIFNPKRIAVIGASNNEVSVGYRLLKNLIGVGFKGFVYPINPFSPCIQGVTAYPSVKKIPWQVDLAIIATPAHVVSQIVEECGESGIPGIIVISSGFKETGSEGRALEEEIQKTRHAYNMRIIGPNCLGVMRPSISLNATFSGKMAKPGKIAFISQSGSLCSSILDWAVQANIGFSHFVSVGSMLNVDFADLIDYFGADPETRSILLFIESISDARRFMSAARRFAGTKPIIVMKAGASPEGTKAATLHTGTPTGEDSIYSAAFRRVGVVRVEEIADLFSCAEILEMQPIPKGRRLVIITNGGGPGVIATDFLVSRGGSLLPLSEGTVKALTEVLPPYWSRSNPVDICDDATSDRFQRTLEICFKEPNADGFIIIYTPQVLMNPNEAAKVLIDVSRDMRKPILTSWMGEEDVREAREQLRRNMVPTYLTPEQAVSAFMHTYEYAQNLELMYETPEEIALTVPADRSSLRKILTNMALEERHSMTKNEVGFFLKAYGMPVADSFGDQGKSLLTLIGKECCPLAVRSKRDPLFGAVIAFGMGGPGYEIIQDLSVELPPLNQTLARRLMERTRICRLLTEQGAGSLANLKALETLLVHFSQMVVDFPDLTTIELNPLVASKEGVVALDGQITVDIEKAKQGTKPYEHLAIRPYPAKYVTGATLRDEGHVCLRPARPEDEPFMVKLFKTFSKETIRLGFFHIMKTFSHEIVSRLCNIDYDREITIVAETPEDTKHIMGLARLIVQPDGESGEIAIVIGDPWQGLGLGTKMLDNIIEVGTDMGLKKVFGEVLAENTKMIHLCHKRGFNLKRQDEESYTASLNLP